MKNNILFVCNTYFQLIVTIQLKLTLLKDFNIDVAISDHSLKANEVVNRLNKTKLFNDVYYIETVKLDRKCRNNRLIFKQYLYSMLDVGTLKELGLDFLNNKVYDTLFYYNLNSSIVAIFSRLYSRNKNLKCSIMEEGILSYNHQFEDVNNKFSKRLKYIFFVRKLLNKKNLFELTDNFYCFYPELYKGKLKSHTIPSISKNSEIKGILSNLFEIDKSVHFDIKEKFIFFSSVCDFEGGEPIGEFELVKEVASIVGKDNLLVKIHPRDKRNIYKENNIKTFENSYIPWEAIQLSKILDDKIFLSAISSSIISANILVEDPIKSYYLFDKCRIKGNSSAEKTLDALKEILLSESLSNKLKFVKCINDLSLLK